MESKKIYFVISLVSLVSLFSTGNGANFGNETNSVQGEVQLDGPNVMLRWTVTDDTIEFELDIYTLGYIGLGISPDGGKLGSDIVITGIHPNGTTYFSVRTST